MKDKIQVGLIYGGQSPEHEVSIMTAKSIRENIDRDNFNIVDIFIDKNGQLDESSLADIDVAFLAVHGPNCEDGKLQQYLEDRSIKYTGLGVEASKINLDKTRMHTIFKKAGIPTVEYQGFKKNEVNKITDYVKKIGFPVFVKPNNTGSSVGISNAHDNKELTKAVGEAFKYDELICVEKAIINPREIEIAVLGNNNLIVSKPGEILTHGKFYSYDTKYIHPFETIDVAKNLSDGEIKKIADLAEKAYRVIGAKGYARVDFFYKDGEIYLNEIQSLPGFTSISMFPKLMANIGIEYKDLVTKIIELAI